MLPAPLQFAAFLAVLGALLWLNSYSPRRYLYLSGFVLPYMTPGLTVGVNLFWYTLLGGLAIVILPLSPVRRWRWLRRSPMNVVIAYVVVVSLTWMIAEYTVLHRYEQAESIGLGAGQAYFKMPVQLISFVLQLSIFYVVPTRARSAADALAAVRGLVTGLAVSCIIGILLVPTVGIGFVGEVSRGTFTSGGRSIFRIGGLSGEPKMLGAFLVPALLLALVVFLGKVRFFRQLSAKRWAVPVMAIGFALTFSTSAWLGFFAGGFVALALATTRRRRGRLLIVMAATMIAAFLVWQTPATRAIVTQRIDKRVFNLETQELEGSKDNYVVDVFADSPEHLFLGFGLGGLDLEAVYYLLRDPKYSLQRQYVRTPTPSVNLARILGDLGIVGLLLFCWFAWVCSREMKALGQPHLALFFAAGMVGTAGASINALSSYFFLSGALLSWARLSQRRDGAERAVNEAAAAR